MWVPLMEKAWAKVRGSYESANGGFNEEAIRVIVGCPVVSYSTYTIDSQAQAHKLWEIIKTADVLGYIMAAGSTVTNQSKIKNECGIDQSHAYSILSAFQIDFGGETTFMLLMRNPWDLTTYTSEWNPTDPRWN